MKKTSGILMCLAELLVGVLLLINPVRFTSGIIMGLGIVLLAMGLVSVAKYFKTAPAEAAREQTLVKGLVILLLGAFCTFKSYWFITTFPLLTMVYGVAILLVGLVRVQWTVDHLRLKTGRWLWTAIGAAVALILAAIILANPFSTVNVLWTFVAISLIAEAVLDVIAFILNARA